MKKNMMSTIFSNNNLLTSACDEYMERSEAVDLFFLTVIFAVLVALTGLYQSKDWNTFLRWVTFIGLGLDAIGALLLVLSEFRNIQKYMWADLLSAQQKLENMQNSGQNSNHNTYLGKDDSGFEKVSAIARDKRTISLPYEKQDDTEIEEFRFWPSGDIYVYTDSGKQADLGSSELLKTWIQEKAQDLTSEKIVPYATIFLLFGFTLQLIAYYFQKL